MTKKQFWQSASNWGLVGGAALFLVNLVAYALRLETSAAWAYEMLTFVVCFALIFYTGRQNAIRCGAEGYSYSRAVGYVFALMMFTGVVYGVGRFVMVNFVGREYYDALNAGAMDTALAMYRGTPMESQMAAARDAAVRAMSNPFVLILGGVFNFVLKGGFLGLILAVFVKRNPDIFAGTPGAASADE